MQTLIPTPSRDDNFYLNFGEVIDGVFRSVRNDSRALLCQHRVVVHNGLAESEDGKSRGETTGFIAEVKSGEARIGSLHVVVKQLPGQYYMPDGGSLVLAWETIYQQDTSHRCRVGACVSVPKAEYVTDEHYDMIAQFIRDSRAGGTISFPREFDQLLIDDVRLKRACERLDRAAAADADAAA